MKRYANSIFTVDVKKMIAKEKEELLDKILNSKIEADCLDDSLYTPENEQDFFLDLMKSDKAECKRNFPKRLVEDENGSIISEDGKKYRTATVEDVKKELKKAVKAATYKNFKKTLDKLSKDKKLKDYVKSNKKLDDAIDLRLKDKEIIEAILKFYGLEKEEKKEVKKVESIKK